ncbi:hypothetical protein DIPPA_16913 [Diplonema papillatum]|nr:hypothetical protein DIPPA_16913 [Diplonema papillatum]
MSPPANDDDDAAEYAFEQPLHALVADSPDSFFDQWQQQVACRVTRDGVSWEATGGVLPRRRLSRRGSSGSHASRRSSGGGEAPPVPRGDSRGAPAAGPGRSGTRPNGDAGAGSNGGQRGADSGVVGEGARLGGNDRRTGGDAGIVNNNEHCGEHAGTAGKGADLGNNDEYIVGDADIVNNGEHAGGDVDTANNDEHTVGDADTLSNNNEHGGGRAGIGADAETAVEKVETRANGKAAAADAPGHTLQAEPSRAQGHGEGKVVANPKPEGCGGGGDDVLPPPSGPSPPVLETKRTHAARLAEYIAHREQRGYDECLRRIQFPNPDYPSHPFPPGCPVWLSLGKPDGTPLQRPPEPPASSVSRAALRLIRLREEIEEGGGARERTTVLPLACPVPPTLVVYPGKHMVAFHTDARSGLLTRTDGVSVKRFRRLLSNALPALRSDRTAPGDGGGGGVVCDKVVDPPAAARESSSVSTAKTASAGLRGRGWVPAASDGDPWHAMAVRRGGPPFRVLGICVSAPTPAAQQASPPRIFRVFARADDVADWAAVPLAQDKAAPAAKLIHLRFAAPVTCRSVSVRVHVGVAGGGSEGDHPTALVGVRLGLLVGGVRVREAAHLQRNLPVAVVKRPAGCEEGGRQNEVVDNQTRCLDAAGLERQLAALSDQQQSLAGPAVYQGFVACCGSKPTLLRAVWKAPGLGAAFGYVVSHYWAGKRAKPSGEARTDADFVHLVTQEFPRELSAAQIRRSALPPEVCARSEALANLLNGGLRAAGRIETLVTDWVAGGRGSELWLLQVKGWRLAPRRAAPLHRRLAAGNVGRPRVPSKAERCTMCGTPFTLPSPAPGECRMTTVAAICSALEWVRSTAAGGTEGGEQCGGTGPVGSGFGCFGTGPLELDGGLGLAREGIGGGAQLQVQLPPSGVGGGVEDRAATVGCAPQASVRYQEAFVCRACHSLCRRARGCAAFELALARGLGLAVQPPGRQRAACQRQDGAQSKAARLVHATGVKNSPEVLQKSLQNPFSEKSTAETPFSPSHEISRHRVSHRANRGGDTCDAVPEPVQGVVVTVSTLEHAMQVAATQPSAHVAFRTASDTRNHAAAAALGIAVPAAGWRPAPSAAPAGPRAWAPGNSADPRSLPPPGLAGERSTPAQNPGGHPCKSLPRGGHGESLGGHELVVRRDTLEGDEGEEVPAETVLRGPSREGLRAIAADVTHTGPVPAAGLVDQFVFLLYLDELLNVPDLATPGLGPYSLRVTFLGETHRVPLHDGQPFLTSATALRVLKLWCLFTRKPEEPDDPAADPTAFPGSARGCLERWVAAEGEIVVEFVGAAEVLGTASLPLTHLAPSLSAAPASGQQQSSLETEVVRLFSSAVLATCSIRARFGIARVPLAAAYLDPATLLEHPSSGLLIFNVHNRQQKLPIVCLSALPRVWREIVACLSTGAGAAAVRKHLKLKARRATDAHNAPAAFGLRPSVAGSGWTGGESFDAPQSADTPLLLADHSPQRDSIDLVGGLPTADSTQADEDQPPDCSELDGDPDSGRTHVSPAEADDLSPRCGEIDAEASSPDPDSGRTRGSRAETGDHSPQCGDTDTGDGRPHTDSWRTRGSPGEPDHSPQCGDTARPGQGEREARIRPAGDAEKEKKAASRNLASELMRKEKLQPPLYLPNHVADSATSLRALQRDRATADQLLALLKESGSGDESLANDDGPGSPGSAGHARLQTTEDGGAEIAANRHLTLKSSFQKASAAGSIPPRRSSAKRKLQANAAKKRGSARKRRQSQSAKTRHAPGAAEHDTFRAADRAGPAGRSNGVQRHYKTAGVHAANPAASLETRGGEPQRSHGPGGASPAGTHGRASVVVAIGGGRPPSESAGLRDRLSRILKGREQLHHACSLDNDSGRHYPGEYETRKKTGVAVQARDERVLGFRVENAVGGHESAAALMPAWRVDVSVRSVKGLDRWDSDGSAWVCSYELFTVRREHVGLRLREHGPVLFEADDTFHVLAPSSRALARCIEMEADTLLSIAVRRKGDYTQPSYHATLPLVPVVDALSRRKRPPVVQGSFALRRTDPPPAPAFCTNEDIDDLDEADNTSSPAAAEAEEAAAELDAWLLASVSFTSIQIAPSGLSVECDLRPQYDISIVSVK